MWENDRSVWNVIWYFEASGVEESCQFSFPITRSCSQSHWLRRFTQPPKWKRFRNFAKKDVALARFIVPISGSNSRARNKHALQLIVIENLFWLLWTSAWTSCRICISGQINKSLYCEEAMVNVNERVWAEFNEALRILKLQNHSVPLNYLRQLERNRWKQCYMHQSIMHGAGLFLFFAWFAAIHSFN